MAPFRVPFRVSFRASLRVPFRAPLRVWDFVWGLGKMVSFISSSCFGTLWVGGVVKILNPKPYTLNPRRPCSKQQARLDIVRSGAAES